MFKFEIDNIVIFFLESYKNEGLLKENEEHKINMYSH